MKTEYRQGNLVFALVLARFFTCKNRIRFFFVFFLTRVAWGAPHVCPRVRALELIVSTLEEEAWMHKARGRSHSRTSSAIRVTCFSDASSFPLPRVAFHLVSVIHLSFSRWDRDSCVADTLSLWFFYFFILLFFFVFFFLLLLSLPLCVALPLFIHVFCPSPPTVF